MLRLLPLLLLLLLMLLPPALHFAKFDGLIDTTFL